MLVDTFSMMNFHLNRLFALKWIYWDLSQFSGIKLRTALVSMDLHLIKFDGHYWIDTFFVHYCDMQFDLLPTYARI